MPYIDQDVVFRNDNTTMYCHLQLERLVSECTGVFDAIAERNEVPWWWLCKCDFLIFNKVFGSERDLAMLMVMLPTFEARSCTSVRFARTASMKSFIPAWFVLVSVTSANSAILAASAISCNDSTPCCRRTYALMVGRRPRSTIHFKMSSSRFGMRRASFCMAEI